MQIALARPAPLRHPRARTEDAGAAVLLLTESLTVASLLDFRKALKACLERQPPPSRLVVEMSGVGRIDAAGIGMLLIARDAAGRISCTVELHNPQGMVAELLAMARLDVLFAITQAVRT